MSQTTSVLIDGKNIVYAPSLSNNKSEVNLDKYLNITETISEEKKNNIVIGTRSIFNIYQDGVLQGYCNNKERSMDAVRAIIATKMQGNKKYKVTTVPVDNMTKVYLYEVSEGYMWNSNYVVAKFRIIEVPKVELKDGL